jgi:hypothetical protein
MKNEIIKGAEEALSYLKRENMLKNFMKIIASALAILIFSAVLCSLRPLIWHKSDTLISLNGKSFRIPAAFPAQARTGKATASFSFALDARTLQPQRIHSDGFSDEAR